MNPSNLSALGSVSFGWLHEEGGFSFDEPFFLDPRVRLERERRMRQFAARRFPHDPIYSIEAHLVQLEGRRRPVALVGAIQPNLILGAAVGARFVFYGDKDPDITPAPLADTEDLDPLWRIDWTGMWPISLLLDQVGSTRERLGDHYAVIPPFFWDTTGRATIHGIVTTAQKLIGDRVFLEIADRSPFVSELFGWIVESYAALIERFAEAAGLEITGLHAGDCSACMVGPDPFAALVLPRLNDLARRIGPLRLHSCGPSDHLLDVFREVENVSSLNVGSNTSVGKIRERFGPIRIDLIPDARLLTGGQPADVDAWVRRCVEENGGGPLQFQYHLDVGAPESNCLQVQRTLESLGAASPRCEIY